MATTATKTPSAKAASQNSDAAKERALAKAEQQDAIKKAEIDRVNAAAKAAKQAEADKKKADADAKKKEREDAIAKRKAEREALAEEAKTLGEKGEIGAKAATDLIPTARGTSAVAVRISETAGQMLKDINSSIETMGDQDVLDAYQQTSVLDTNTWITKSRLANEAYKRIKGKITSKITKEGSESRVEAEVGTAIKNVCTAMNVGLQTFKYDRLIWSLIFAPEGDVLEGISHTDMFAAAELLQTKSLFAEACNCSFPRTMVKELTALATKGESVTVKVARDICNRLNAKAKGIAYEGRTSTNPYAIQLRAGELPEDVVEFIQGIINGATKAIADKDSVAVSVSPNGSVIFQTGAISLEKTEKSRFYFGIDVKEVKAEDGTISHQVGTRIGLATTPGLKIALLTEEEYKAIGEARAAKAQAKATPKAEG